MAEAFFEMVSPRDLLSKAKREFARLKLDLSTDNIWNFFVTAYHVMDYVKVQGRASRASIDKMYNEPDFQLCNSICNQGKHLKHKKGDPILLLQGNPGTFGSATFGSAMFGGGGGTYRSILDSGQASNVLELGDRVVVKWEQFFTENGI